MCGSLSTLMTSDLSPLERAILKKLWPQRRLKVRELFTLLKNERSVALTSIAVALDRLHSKSIVDRTITTGRGGIRYVYFPRKSRAEFEKSVVEATVNKLITRFGTTALSYFNERFKK